MKIHVGYIIAAVCCGLMSLLTHEMAMEDTTFGGYLGWLGPIALVIVACLGVRSAAIDGVYEAEDSTVGETVLSEAEELRAQEEGQVNALGWPV